MTLGGRTQNREVLGMLLSEAAGIDAFHIDDNGVLTAYVSPGHGELDIVRALVAAGMYPLETLDVDQTFSGGSRAS